LRLPLSARLRPLSERGFVLEGFVPEKRLVLERGFVLEEFVPQKGFVLEGFVPEKKLVLEKRLVLEEEFVSAAENAAPCCQSSCERTFSVSWTLSMKV
jgi:hypothetical protein